MAAAACRKNTRFASLSVQASDGVPGWLLATTGVGVSPLLAVGLGMPPAVSPGLLASAELDGDVAGSGVLRPADCPPTQAATIARVAIDRTKSGAGRDVAWPARARITGRA